MKIKKVIKVGSQVKLLVGPKEKRKSAFSVKAIKGDMVYLDGYKLVNRTVKVTQESTNNYKTVHHAVHISNISLES